MSFLAHILYKMKPAFRQDFCQDSILVSVVPWFIGEIALHMHLVNGAVL